MIARAPARVRCLYRQLADGRFAIRFSDRPQVYEGAPGEKIDTLVERMLAVHRPELKHQPMPFEKDRSDTG